MKRGKVIASCKKSPGLSVQFPPAGYAFAHRPKTGENWSTIAVQYSRNNVWDIIFYNFGTYDPKVVNWCMETYLGSTHTTDDGKNYVFHNEDRPGLVYVPPQDWVPGAGTGLTAEDLMARDRVLAVLGSPYIKKINFVSPVMSRVYPGLFQEVASLIHQGRIGVRYVGGNHAEYDPDNNLILLGFLDTASGVQRSRILHECLHAAHDALQAGMLQAYMEADCYVAQMIYLIQAHDEYRKKAPVGRSSAETLMYQHAWGIARLALGLGEVGSTPPDSPVYPGAKQLGTLGYGNLAMAIASHPDYAGSAWDHRQMDGV